MTQDSASNPPPAESGPPTRICGRCRQTFDGDPTLPTGPFAEWWLCADCRGVLLPRRVATAEAIARAGDPR